MTKQTTLTRDTNATLPIIDEATGEVLNTEPTNTALTDPIAVAEEKRRQILERMQQDRENIKSRLGAATVPVVRPKQNKHFIMPDETTKPYVDAIIISFGSSNSYYDKPFDPDNHSSPVCAAVGIDVRFLTPHENAPQAQHTDCATCPKNQFKSAANKKGKACRNARRIVFLNVSDGHTAANAEMMSIEAPPTSIRAFDNYVHSLNSRFGTVPYAVRTRISLDKEATWATLIFECTGLLTEDDIVNSFDRISEAETIVTAAPAFTE